jgi:hypothetical protein
MTDLLFAMVLTGLGIQRRQKTANSVSSSVPRVMERTITFFRVSQLQTAGTFCLVGSTKHHQILGPNNPFIQ